MNQLNRLPNKEFKKQIRLRRRKEVQEALKTLLDKSASAWKAKFKMNFIIRELKLSNARQSQMGLSAPRSIVASIIMGLLAVFAALLLDYSLLASVSEFIVTLSYDREWVAALAMIAVPLGIVFLELNVSTKLVLAKDSTERWQDTVSSSDKKEVWLWQGIGILSILVLTTLIIATFLTKLEVDEDTLNLSNAMLLAGLVCLTGLCHGSIIFGGQHAYESREYLLILLKQWRLKRKLRKVSLHYVKQAKETAQQYIAYNNLRSAFIELYPSDNIKEGPYDNSTKRVVSDYFGLKRVDFAEPAPKTPNNPEPNLNTSSQRVNVRDAEIQGTDLSEVETQETEETNYKKPINDQKTEDRSPEASDRINNPNRQDRILNLLKRLWNN